ncbi:hypothetical protein THARTR1_09552 [Trichoderma harzianum]|uniref:Uncharacterized protein n=1 Tax=Trichoderma harzianum TaxID=5544 RepID=A0A2K0TW78_TRIHA|nr:hypothetical protein THARTR1_09552 [Trichoderma harzianum]
MFWDGHLHVDLHPFILLVIPNNLVGVEFRVIGRQEICDFPIIREAVYVDKNRSLTIVNNT